jgi:hypothetical protein
MLKNRKYSSSDREVLYHYCTPDTLLALCTFKTLRFSDLYAMNDFMELHWGYHTWEIAAGEVFNAVGKEFLDDIDAIIHQSGARVLPLAACLSRDGDVLSQWRAYGADGQGYAVGFDSKRLMQMPVKTLKVEYDHRTQIEEVKQFILALHLVESEEATPRGPDFFNACALLASDLASFKNPAFIEEDEVRLIYLLNFQKSNESLKLVDPGGTSFEVAKQPQEVKFRMNGSTPVPYMDISFTSDEGASPIVEVVLGPKNDSLLSGVSVFLETFGHSNVKIRKSGASYR